MDELGEQGLGLAVISYDPVEILAGFSEQFEIDYPLLSDPDSATIKRYGILNTVAEEGLGPNRDNPAVLADVEQYVTVTSAAERFLGIPYPGTFSGDKGYRKTVVYLKMIFFL